MTFHIPPGRASGLLVMVSGALLLLAATCPAMAQGKKTEFVSPHGFTLQYPALWEFRGQPNHCRIDNFPLSQWRRGAGLPPGGASVIVMAPRELAESKGLPMPKTMDEWVAMGSGSSPESKSTFAISDGSRRVSGIEVRTLCCAAPPYQENVTWYFAVGNQFLSATLLRWQGQGSDRDLSLLRELVLSIRMIQTKIAE